MPSRRLLLRPLCCIAQETHQGRKQDEPTALLWYSSRTHFIIIISVSPPPPPPSSLFDFLPLTTPLLFFWLAPGLVGLFNIVLLWPAGLFLNLIGVESFELPKGYVWLYLTINGLIGTVLSDYLWLWSVLLTSPLVATVGLRYKKQKQKQKQKTKTKNKKQKTKNTSKNKSKSKSKLLLRLSLIDSVLFLK